MFDEHLQKICDMFNVLNKKAIFEEMEEKLKAIQYNKNEAVQIADLLSSLMKQAGLYIMKDEEDIYHRQLGAKHTYEWSGGSKKHLLDKLWAIDNAAIKDKLQKSELWLLRTNIKTLPCVEIDVQMIELKDCMYSFKDGLRKYELEEGKSCVNYFSWEEFDNLTWPEKTLELLKKNDVNIIDFLEIYGAIFHERKKGSKVLYIEGVGGSGKTLITEGFLKQLLGARHLAWITIKGGFNLEGADKAWAMMLNDHRWGNLATTEVLNLFTGDIVMVNRKNKPALKIENKNIFVNSNEKVPSGEEYQRRVKTFTFSHIASKEHYQQMSTEAVGFSILTNIFYLKSIKQEVEIPNNWISLIKVLEIYAI